MRFVCSLPPCEAVRYTTLAGRTTARILRCEPLSATILPTKSPYEGGVDESLPPKVRELLPARSTQMPPF